MVKHIFVENERLEMDFPTILGKLLFRKIRFVKNSFWIFHVEECGKPPAELAIIDDLLSAHILSVWIWIHSDYQK